MSTSLDKLLAKEKALKKQIKKVQQQQLINNLRIDKKMTDEFLIFWLQQNRDNLLTSWEQFKQEKSNQKNEY